jgi:hypothetical protein
MVFSSSVAPEIVKRWQKRAAIFGTCAALVTIFSIIIPVIFSVLAADRDREVAEMREAMKAQARELRELKGIVRESISATKTRFAQNEENVRYLREAVVAIRTELDLRFGKSPASPLPSISSRDSVGSVSSSSVSMSNTNKKEHQLLKLAQKSNSQLQKSDKAAPRGDPLAGISM